MPEYFGPSNGVALMEDLREGAYRLYIYHVPGTNGVAKTVSVVVQNEGKRRLHLEVAVRGVP